MENKIYANPSFVVLKATDLARGKHVRYDKLRLVVLAVFGQEMSFRDLPYNKLERTILALFG